MHVRAPAHDLWWRLHAGLESAAIAAIAELGVPDLLGEHGAPVAEVARRAGVDAGRLARVLRYLAATGLLVEVEPGTFANTPVSEVLRGEAGAPHRAFARYVQQLLLPASLPLADAARRGTSGIEERFGSGLFDLLAASPPLADVYARAMAGSSLLRSDVTLAHAWPGRGTVVDAGGSDGTILTRVLEANPGLEGVVVDLPHLEAAATAHIRSAGLGDRCSFRALDLFAGDWPSADVVLLSAVLHDWDDDAAVELLGHARRSLRPGGRILVVDAVLPPANDDPAPEVVMDLVMLVMTETGRERTAPEWGAVFERAGLTHRVVSSSWRVALIEAVPTSTGSPHAARGDAPGGGS
jgi:SAM-dependent methyltransferase